MFWRCIKDGKIEIASGGQVFIDSRSCSNGLPDAVVEHLDKGSLSERLVFQQHDVGALQIPVNKGALVGVRLVQARSDLLEDDDELERVEWPAFLQVVGERRAIHVFRDEVHVGLPIDLLLAKAVDRQGVRILQHHSELGFEQEALARLFEVDTSWKRLEDLDGCIEPDQGSRGFVDPRETARADATRDDPLSLEGLACEIWRLDAHGSTPSRSPEKGVSCDV